MASRSRIIHEEDDEGWLRLGLGPVCNYHPPISDPSEFRIGQELGLGLGFGNDGISTEPPPSSYHQRWFQPLGSSSSSSPSSPATLPPLWSSPSLSPWVWPLHGDFPGNPLHVSQKREVGVWFYLRSCSSRGWGREALPQVPKAYIRVKDESATVLMVKNYLVRKLGLSSELEIDITCMGNKLLPTQTLKYVRDEVWLPSLIDSFDGMASNESVFPVNQWKGMYHDPPFESLEFSPQKGICFSVFGDQINCRERHQVMPKI